MNRMKAAAVCGILSLSLFAGVLSGCGSKVNGADPAVVVNNETVSVGTANYVLRYQQAETYTLMMMYGLAAEGNMWDQVVSTSENGNVYYGTDFKNDVLTTIEQNALARQHAGDYGVALSDEQKTRISEVAQATYDANKEAFDKNGISAASVQEALEMETLRALLYSPVTADVDTVVSDEEANQSTVTYARFPTTEYSNGAQVPIADDVLAERKTAMNTLLEQILALDDPASADFMTMKADVDDAILVSTVNYGSDDKTLPDEVKEQLAQMQDGEVYDQVMETDRYLYIIRLDQAHNEEKTQEKRESIIEERKNTLFGDTLQGWMDASAIEVKDGWNDLKVTDQDGFSVKAAGE